MTCDCADYGNLELNRDSIFKRIRESRKLKKRFEVVAVHDGGKNKLSRCAACGQLWQSSRAWMWGNGEYLFRVPAITVEEWLAQPYAQPVDMLVYSGAMKSFFERQTFVEKAEPCRIEGCAGNAIELSVLCLNHHIESLQNAGALAKTPKGRIFPPYHLAGSEGES